MERAFKAGDRVKCISDQLRTFPDGINWYSGYYTVGNTYTVIDNQDGRTIRTSTNRTNLYLNVPASGFVLDDFRKKFKEVLAKHGKL